MWIALRRMILTMRSAVQPADEPPGTPDVRRVLARYAELPVDHAGGDDHGVIGGHLVPRKVAADLDVAGEAQVGLRQQPVELTDHRRRRAREHGAGRSDRRAVRQAATVSALRPSTSVLETWEDYRPFGKSVRPSPCTVVNAQNLQDALLDAIRNDVGRTGDHK